MVHLRSDSWYRLHPREWNRLKEEWMSGKAFFEGKTLHGADFVVKLAAVEAIQNQTPDVIRSIRDEEAADQAEDSIEGRE